MNTETAEKSALIVERDPAWREPAQLPVAVPMQASPMAMLQMAVQQGADIETIKELRAIQKEWEADEARKAFNAAFARFKSEVITIIKSKKYDSGPLKGKGYAELYSVVDAVTPRLSPNGLSISWSLTKDEKDWLEVTCTLRHELGHSESVSMGGPPDAGGTKSPVQERMSTVTFLERYTLKAICGVSEREDDTDGAGSRKGMTEEQFADFKAAIEGEADPAKVRTLMAKISGACSVLKDKASFDELAALVKARLEALKGEKK